MEFVCGAAVVEIVGLEKRVPSNTMPLVLLFSLSSFGGDV